jgi:hypothetical protein
MDINDQNKKLVDIKEKYEEELFAIPGVTGVGVGYKVKDESETNEECIIVYVAKKIPEDEIEKIIPKYLDGVPTDVVEATFQAFGQAYEYLYALRDTSRHDPLIGGISIGPKRSIGGFVYVGTLGVIVKDRPSNRNYMLSNWHVMAVNDSARRGDVIVQPSRVDGSGSNDAGTLERFVINQNVDCAIANISGRGATPYNIKQIGNTSGFNLANINMRVQKRGRTTGLKEGKITDVSATVDVNYGSVVRRFRNQIIITSSTVFSQGGDSGSVIVEKSSKKIVGLLFAGSSTGTRTIANKIQNVISALNLTV